MNHRILTVLSLSVLLSASAFAQKVTVSEADKQRAANIVSQMTLDEKAAYVGGYDSFYIRAIDRLGLPAVKMADASVGVRNDTQSTQYPASVMLAATWNPDMARLAGEGVGRDARARGVGIMLGPGVNIYRYPLNGRNFEYLGEDPYLASRMAVPFIEGLQSNGVMACAKHYAANNSEWNRHHSSSDVDERTLHEIYLPAFKAAVEEAGVACIMNSYNMIWDLHNSENRYLNIDVLRKMWGFEGIVMTDWEGAHSTKGMLEGGTDIEMPSGRYMSPEAIKRNIKNGGFDERELDVKCTHIIQTMIAFGMLDRPQKDSSIPEDCPESVRTALDEAREGIVLLKNDGILPLKKNVKLSLMGPNASHNACGGGSSKVTPIHMTTVADGLHAHKGVNLIFVEAENLADVSEGEFYADKAGKVRGLKAEYFANKELSGTPVISRVEKVISHNWSGQSPDPALDANSFSARWSGWYCPKENGHVKFEVGGDDGYRMKVDGVEVFSDWCKHANRSKEYVMDCKAGDRHFIEMEYYEGGGDAEFSFRHGNVEYMDAGIKEVKNADAVVICVGYDTKTETEGSDRLFELPAGQVDQIKRVAAINPNVIVVVNCGAAFETASWINDVKAVVMAFYPGQEGGMAVADVLTGTVAPSGRLPFTFDATLQDSPCYNSYLDNKPYPDEHYCRISYDEGLMVGYRGYDFTGRKPLYPFGYGLTYTDFEYSGMTVSKGSDGKVKVTLNVRNTGKADAYEVVQIYVKPCNPSVVRPVKELKAFAKPFIRRGKTVKVELELDKSAFEYYDVMAHDWRVDPGVYDILAGHNACDIRLSERVKI